MLDPRRTIDPATASVHDMHDMDGQCRGIGPEAVSHGEPGLPRGARGGVSTDVAVERRVVRDGEPHAIRHAVTDIVTRAASRERSGRAPEPWRHPSAAGATLGDAWPTRPSAELAPLLDHLRTLVAEYVAGRRSAGVPIERVLPEMKGLVREAAACEWSYDPAETLVQQVVGWTIGAYYDEPQAQDAAGAP